MPLIRVVRNGQVTIPKDIRDQLGINEGDFLEVEPTEAGVFLRTKVMVDKSDALKALTKAFEKLRASDKVQQMDETDINAIIEEAIRAARSEEGVKGGKAAKR